MARKPTGKPATVVLAIRVTAAQHAALTEVGRFTKETANDLMREALEQAYPEIFSNCDTPGSNMTHDPSAGLPIA
jgi:hypothetical protein